MMLPHPIKSRKQETDEAITIDDSLSELLAELKDNGAGLEAYLDFLDEYDGLHKEQSYTVGVHVYSGKHANGVVEVLVEEAYGQIRGCKIILNLESTKG